jgi:argininosuccinate lyase
MEVLRKAFKQPLDPLITRFVASIDDDKALVKADLEGSLAHVEMLIHSNLISFAQGEKIKTGLTRLLAKANADQIVLKPEYEDVHMNMEKQLEELIGQDALRLHTARSRNDQVAVDMRIFIMHTINQLSKLLIELQSALLSVASQSTDMVVPGYTHLQPAQPLVFAHVMLAFFEMFKRDLSRFMDAKKRTAISPLGAGALSGSRLPIDPKFTAEKLGFTDCFSNSLDAVSDRDFIGEFLFASSLISSHLSQLAETLIIWSSKEFNFVTFPDSITTSSSLMPQKKNADPLELIRAKTGIALGELVNFLAIIKGLPIGYNRDLQETKPPAIKVAGMLALSLPVMTIVINQMQLNRDVMLVAAGDSELMATDVVEYLVVKGMPFREAHESVAKLVQHTRDNGADLSKLDLSIYRQFSSLFSEDVFDCFDPRKSLTEKNSHGSSGIKSVEKALAEAKKWLTEFICE